MRFLNSKERKQFFGELKELYGYEGPTDYVVYEGGRDKYYIISRDVENIPFEEMRLKHAGLYVANQMISGLRLTMDGAQLLGKHCSKVLPVDEAGMKLWMSGLAVPCEEDGFFIVSYEGDVIGCGYAKEGELRNYVPKERRISEFH